MTASLLLQAAAIALGLLSSGPLVSVQANFDFTVRFYEYWNPTGLCAECGTNSVPVCCDDPLLTESCQNTGVFRCDTKFRYIPRPFNAPLDTAPGDAFPYFTRSQTNENHETFGEGDGGFLGSPNPNTLTNPSPWTGRIQLLVDAVDRINSNQAPDETVGIVDRFLINLDQLRLGADLTEQKTYTGIYNISQLAMSFQVNCSENYYGSNCTTFCEAKEGVYNCDSNGNIVCVENNRDSSTMCINCTENYYGSDCTTSCEAVEGVYNCDNNGSIICVNANQDPRKNCTIELSENGVDASLIGGVVGGLVGLLVFSILLVLIILCVILGLQFQHKRIKTYVMASNTVDYVEQLSADTSNKKEEMESSTASNPIYWVTDSGTPLTTTNNTIYDEPQLELTQNVKNNPRIANYEMVDCPQENKSDHTSTQIELADDPNYSAIESIEATAGLDKNDIPVFDDPEYGIASCQQTEQPTAVFDCAEYESPTVTATYDIANRQQTEQPTTIFDCVEYESPTVTTTSGYSVLNNSAEVLADHGTSTPPETLNGAGEGYSKLHHDTETETNCCPQNTQHPSPQHIYDVATSNETEQNHVMSNEDALVYHYATVDSPAHPTINNSIAKDSSLEYVNTTPGKITPDALDHYDLGQ